MSDADARGGAALSIVKITSTPILYVGVGQEYDDLISFDKNIFLENVFERYETNLPESAPAPEPAPEPEPEPESDDPFEGIDTDDINKYADWFDIPPPESDKEAKALALKIRKWISDGRTKP